MTSSRFAEEGDFMEVSAPSLLMEGSSSRDCRALTIGRMKSGIRCHIVKESPADVLNNHRIYASSSQMAS